MRIFSKSLLVMMLSAVLPVTVQAAGIVSTVASATDDIVVSSTAEATVTATGRTDLIAGSYPDGFHVASWTGSVTSGTIAYRVNPSVNTNVVQGRWGTTTNSSDSNKKVKFSLNYSGEPGPTTLLDGWRVSPQGVSTLNAGSVDLDGAQTLTPGSYPVGIDVAAYAY